MVNVIQCGFKNVDNCEAGGLTFEECIEAKCDLESKQYEMCIWKHVECRDIYVIENEKEISNHSYKLIKKEQITSITKISKTLNERYLLLELFDLWLIILK
jgi:hypothetical protein